MAKVKQVKARKDYPQHGIAKGDLHYTWSLMVGPRASVTYRQKTPPRPSQLTTSEFLGRMGDLEHGFLEFEMSHDDAAEEFLQGMIEELESIAEDQEEKRESMPENLYYSANAERMEERAEAARSWASEIKAILDDGREAAETAANCDWRDLEEFEGIDPEEEDEDDLPSQEEIERVRHEQIDSIWQDAIQSAADACGGYD